MLNGEFVNQSAKLQVSADYIVNYFFLIYFPGNRNGQFMKFVSMETIALNVIFCFLEKNKQSTINMLSAEIAKRVVKVKGTSELFLH